MKRIKEYKDLFEVEGTLELSQLKKTYRNLVKEWHPDKFPSESEKAVEAEEMSRKVIEAYHFLVSIAPETMAKELEDYKAMLASTTIDNYDHKGQVLEVTFTNGMSYEYFGVAKNVVNKLNQSPTPMRFARRNVFTSFLYRKSKKEEKVASSMEA